MVKNLLDAGHPHLDVAERQKMPLQLVWAIDMEGRTDKERMARLSINVQPYDVWGACGGGENFRNEKILRSLAALLHKIDWYN